MNGTAYREPILLMGTGKLAASVYLCLRASGHRVYFYSDEPQQAIARIGLLMNHSEAVSPEPVCEDLDQAGVAGDLRDSFLAVIITPENILEKKLFIKKVEKIVSSQTIITINTESFALSDIQAGADSASRIIGANWSEPAHTTFFLEIITNQASMAAGEQFYSFSRQHLQKDPYLLKSDHGIRTRMLCALIREAFYLVENGYVSVDDIDRACRNDAGFYLPFAGNFRYMDLMGTYIYGIVMKDLNPELSIDTHVPVFFKEIISRGGVGMENNLGIYKYDDEEAARWDALFHTFSHQIHAIINKYPVANSQQPTKTEILTTAIHE